MKQSILTFTKKILRHELITGSVFIFLGTLLANIINFLFNLFLTHTLSYGDYGIYAAVIALVALLSIPGQAISPIVLRFATEYITHKELGKAKSFYMQSSLLVLGMSGVILFGLLVGSHGINNFFKLHSELYLILAGCLVAMGFLNTITSTYLQSLLRFKYIAVSTIVSSIGKLLLGIGFVLLGWEVTGALGGFVCASLVSLIFVVIPIVKLFISVKKVSVTTHIREIISYGVFSSVSMFSLASFTSSDILLVKHFFPVDVAGLYAGLSLIGRIIFYFSAPVITVMFPLLMNKFHKGERMQGVLYLSLVLVFLPSIFLSIIFSLFPTFFLTVFLGGRDFLKMSPYVGMYGIYIALYGFCTVMTNFFLTIKNAWASSLVGIAALIQIIGIVLLHKNFSQIITISIFSLLFLACSLLGLFMHYNKTSR